MSGPDEVIRAWGRPTDPVAMLRPPGWVPDRTHREWRGVWVEHDRPLSEVLDGHLRGMAMVTPDFELLALDKQSSMVGLPCFGATCRYRFAHAALPEWYPTRERILLLDHGLRIWHLRVVDYPELGPGMALPDADLRDLVILRFRR